MSVSGTEQIKNRPLISLCVSAHPPYKTKNATNNMESRNQKTWPKVLVGLMPRACLL